MTPNNSGNGSADTYVRVEHFVAAPTLDLSPPNRMTEPGGSSLRGFLLLHVAGRPSSFIRPGMASTKVRV